MCTNLPMYTSHQFDQHNLRSNLRNQNMAEAIGFEIAAKVVVELGSILLKDLWLLRDLKEEMEKLKIMVSTIQALLLDAEEKFYKSHQVRDWLLKLKQVMYDADDLLDDFSTEVMQRQLVPGGRFGKKVRTFFSSSNQVAYGLKMAHKIKAVRLRLNAIADERKFRLDVRPAVLEFVRERVETHSSISEGIIGRDDDKDKILESLLSREEETDKSAPIVSIWGIGGLGKTTLAQLIFNDAKVQSEFELRLWVCVSQNFDVKQIVENIIEDFTKKKPEKNLQLNTLVNSLHKIIKGRRYLLVLDDVWNEDFNQWSSLKDLLRGGARHSKILVTTRSKKVAEVTSTLAQFELKGLSEVKSWELFTKMAFRTGQEPISPNHEAIGKEIIGKCVGVPLAIKTIARLLYFKPRESEWLSFKDKELYQLDQQETDILPMLKLSYDHLPSHLKQCFAFCSLYPKSHKIEVQRLIGLWIAGGFVKCKDPNECLEDIGFDYFMDLLWRSFFHEVETDKTGDIKYCKMHDLMHDLSKQMSGKECVLLDSNVIDFDMSTRHISFGVNFNAGSLCRISPGLLQGNKIRTVLLHNARGLLPADWEQYEKFFAHLRRLRILDLNLSWLNSETLPRFISKLKHLRYLGISDPLIKSLPRFITKLPNLQVLNLNDCTRLKQLPSEIKGMINLRQLHLRNCDALGHMPHGLGKLTALQVLSKFVVGDETHSGGGLDELRNLNNLKGELEIINLRAVTNPKDEFVAANLKQKGHLQHVVLNWNPFFSDATDDGDDISMEALQPHMNLKQLIIKGNGRTKYPTWISTLTNLVDLRIEYCRTGEHISSIDHLPSLKKLWFSRLDDLEYIEVGAAFPFPSLEELTLMRCEKLKGWCVNTPKAGKKLLEFSCLLGIRIVECWNLTWIPSSCPSLKSLWLYTVNVKLVELILESTISSSGSSPNSSASSLLTDLNIFGIDDLEVLPDDLLRHLIVLERVRIHGCQKLRTLPRAMKYWTCLKEVKIGDCNELDLSNDGLEWQHLKSLCFVEIADIPKLESLPEGLKHATALRKLYVENCTNMKSLPDWVDSLKELKYMFIKYCPPGPEQEKGTVTLFGRSRNSLIA